MRAVAGSLGIGPLDLPWADGPRLWRAEDIAAHLPLFKDHAPKAATSDPIQWLAHGSERLAPHAYLCERCT